MRFSWLERITQLISASVMIAVRLNCRYFPRYFYVYQRYRGLVVRTRSLRIVVVGPNLALQFVHTVLYMNSIQSEPLSYSSPNRCHSPNQVHRFGISLYRPSHT